MYKNGWGYFGREDSVLIATWELHCLWDGPEMLVPLYTHRNRERDGGVQWIFNDLVIPFQLVEKLGRITQKKYDELNLPSLNPYIGPSVQKKKNNFH